MATKRTPARFRHAIASRIRPLLGFAMAAGLMLLGGHAGAAADDSPGAQLAATCASCHSPSGSNEGIPVIAGIEEQKIIEAMHAYKASETPSHVMHAVALSLTDEELASVAAYLAAHGATP
jgi:cytochrome subunit of sulfide dehydrogenase